MCKVNEHIEREKPNVEPPSRKPIVRPGKKGTGILQD